MSLDDELLAAIGQSALAAQPADATITPHLTVGVTVRRDDESAPHPFMPDAQATLPGLPPLELASGADSASAELSIIGVLGEGGMGRVLLARQRSLGRDVAVKVPRAEVPSDSIVTSLIAEARVTGHLEHPSIVPIHALGRDGRGNPALVMKRIDGVVWADLLSEPDHPAWPKLTWVSSQRRTAHLELFLAVCNAVHFAHSRGIVHRDLKPANVMIGEFGEVYVTDWGVALSLDSRSRQPRTLVGTPAYMAPEMARCEVDRIDARTDVFLLGAVLHQILTGGHRHGGATVAEVVQAAMAPGPVAYGAAAPEELAAIANKATAADPSQRFESAQLLQRAVAEHLRHLGSIELTDTASRLLDELRARVAARAQADDPGPVERLGTECRLGFLHALRSWPENPVALRGLQACLEVIAGDRVSRGDAAGARAVLAELTSHPPELVARLEALERAASEKVEQVRALESMARDLDPHVATRARIRLMLAALGVNAVLGVVFFAPMVLNVEHSTRLLLMPLAGAVVGVALQVLSWRSLETTFNRRVIGLIAIGFTMVFVHRLIVLKGDQPLRPMFQGDLIILATVMLASSLTQQRLLWLAALPFFGAVPLLPADNEGMSAVFGGAAAVSVLVAIATTALAGKDKSPATQGTLVPKDTQSMPRSPRR